MVNFLNHAADAGVVFLLHDLGNPVKSETLKGLLLVFRITNLTLYLLDFNSCHIRNLSVKHFTHRNTTCTGHGIGVTHLAESLDGSLNQVVGIGRTLRLGEHIGNTGTL